MIIKNKKYEEVVEFVRPPNVPPFFKLNTGPDNTDPISSNNYQVPNVCYQELHKPEFDFNNYQNDYSYTPDSQKIEQIDGSTVVSYNNYFKMPTTYNSNYKYKPIPTKNINNNNYCGYVPIRPNQTGNNGWTCRHETQGAGDVDRIWKTWKNTEYYIKSKNALNQIANEKLQNFLNQDNSDRKYIQRRNVVGNDYYRSQNISPYL